MSTCEAPRASSSLWSGPVRFGSVGEMTDRNTKTQEAVYSSSDQLNRSDVQHTVQIKEEAPEDQSPGVDQQDPESLHIKEEEEEVWDSLEEEQLNVIVVFPLKSEDDEEKLHQHQMENRGVPTSSSAVMKTGGADVEDRGGAETRRDTDLNPHGDTSSSSETEISEDDEEDEDVNNSDFHVKPLSDSGSTSEDCNKDWKESRAPESGGNKLFSCSECGKQIVHTCSLQRHMTCHSAGSCLGKEISVGGKKNIGLHRKVQVRPKIFSCDECEKRFNSKAKLIRHTRVHTGEKPFGCELCEQKFSQKTNLTAHMRVHTGEREFGCDVCGQRFSNKKNLNRHLRVHTGEKPFVCAFCEQRFNQKTNLNRHLKIHTGQKEFECEVCGKKMSNKQNLNTHTRVHTGEKLFECEICGQRFSHKSNLNSHLRVHTGQKLFECGVCGRGFNKKTNLNTHENSHRKENI